MNQIGSSGSTALGGTGNSSAKPISTGTANANIEGAAFSAHDSVDSVADTAAAQVNRLGGTAHNAVNSAADAASSAANWASDVTDQAKQATASVTKAACSSIRGRPISYVAGALAIGYLLGRIGN